MERTITAKEKQQILNFGAFDYDVEKCAIILGWSIAEVTKLMKNKKSQFCKTFNEGKVKAEYVIDLKLFEQAQSGDVASLNKLEMRQRKRKSNR